MLLQFLKTGGYFSNNRFFLEGSSSSLFSNSNKSAWIFLLEDFLGRERKLAGREFHKTLDLLKITT